MKKTKTLICMLILLLLITYIPTITLATETNIITINNIQVSENVTIPGIQITKQMDNGTEKENIEIGTIINITEPGTYEISGILEDGQISINANNINGEIKIILNNCNINCNSAPAIFVYSRNTENENCKITIETAKDSQNFIKGSKLKTSVEGWENQKDIEYYIEKGTDDSGKYYERYKYDGAISSDISLTFEGEGALNVEGLDKEGIESKGNLTFNSGDIIINSQDDAINACTDEKENVIFAFKTNREISCFAISSEKFDNNSTYKVYSNAEITGTTNEYGVYEQIANYNLEKATLEEHSNQMGMMQRLDRPNENMSTVEDEEEKDYKKIAIPIIAIGVIIIIVMIILNIKFKNQLTILNFVIGIIVGIILTCGMFLLINPEEENKQEPEIQRNEPQFQQSQLPEMDRP